MANRYWVGGAGTWNTSSTTNWSASSGGASGASVPTAADSVFFDQAGTYTVATTGALTCLDFTVSAGTVTFATGATFAISGSMSLIAGTVWQPSGGITFNATTTGKVITTNGANLVGNITFNGVGGGWTLGSALTATLGSLTVTNGTFDTSSSGNYSVTVQALSSSGTSTRTINLNASTINVAANPVIFSSTLTFNAGTSQINASSATANFSSAGFTFYNVSFTSTTAGTKTISGANTFNNLSVTAPSTAGVATLTFSANQTINGTLSTTGTAGNRRVFFASATYGIGFTLTVANKSLTDADFRDLYIIGVGTPLTGTRIGNRGNCSGITFSTPKTVYWNLAGAQNWSANGWATTPTGTPSTDNFPLPQDTATFTNAGSVTGNITLDAAIGYVSTVDMSGRTTAMTLAFTATTWYGNWTNGSGTAFAFSLAIQTLSGGGTQTITSAGKSFFCPIVVDTYGGIVQLADAFSSSSSITVTNGTFNTQGFSLSFTQLISNNSNVRAINLSSSTLTSNNFSPINISTLTNLTFNAGTSTINFTSTFSPSLAGGLVYYNVSFVSASSLNIGAGATFNNLTFPAPASTGFQTVFFNGNQTINGTLTCAGASAIRRIFIQSNTVNTQRTLTVNSLSANDCDFRDIVIAGTASGSTPTRAGNCGNNSGITFTTKTAYWNLAGAQNWSATGWATSSGGAPAANNFPLAQDTVVFDNTGAAGTVTIDAAWNIGDFDASLRTSAMTFTTHTNSPVVYGNWKFGTGFTSSRTTGAITFSKNGTQIITSNGVQFGCPITVNNLLGTVQPADALSLNSAAAINLTAGTFDAVTYNITIGAFINGSTSNTLKMGSGTWTLSGTGSTLWDCTTAPTIIAGTSTVVLSDTSTTARTFSGGGYYYNKLTIGGATGISTLTVNGNNTFGELASTKTVAHTIAFGTTVQIFGKWAVTGTVGNVVTITGTATTNQIYGPAVTGIDYLAMGTWGISTISPGEFYAGANSTGTAAAPVFRTAAPAPRTLYWVGGTGNWSSTTKWSLASGGASGEAIPTSLDSVIFDSASNATAYTATIDAGVTMARCAAFTMAGPAAGNVTFAGTVPIAYHGNFSFAATGVTYTGTGTPYLAGNGSYTFTMNGKAFNNFGFFTGPPIVGIGSTWTLGSAITFYIAYHGINIIAGNFNTNGYTITNAYDIYGWSHAVKTLSLGASTMVLNGSPIMNTFNVNEGILTTNLTLNSGTSSLSCSSSGATFNGRGLTWYNLGFSGFPGYFSTLLSESTYNRIKFNTFGQGLYGLAFSANQTITSLDVSGGSSVGRGFLSSSVLGTQRTLTVGSYVSAQDIDFRDINIAGAAAGTSVTRGGDCGGNSGITFPAAKTVYYRQTGSNSWGVASPGSWSLTSGGALDATAFPLAQDTAVFPAATYPASGSTTTINAIYNIGTINMSLRTSNTMTLATGTTTPLIHGNWINGTGTTLSGTEAITFAGRTTQQITSSSKTFTQPIAISSPSGSVTIQDAFITSAPFTSLAVNNGTFNANNYNVTLSSPTSTFNSSNSNIRTVALGSGTWTLAGSWTAATSTNLTVTGSATITMTSGSTHSFTGGGILYSGITLNQAGGGALNFNGNNTFGTISNTYVGGTTIQLNNTTQTVGAWTASGTAGNLLTITGANITNIGTLIYTGVGAITGLDYLVPTLIRAYSPTTTWYAGNNSTNGGSLGWIFASGTSTIYNVYIVESNTALDSISAAFGSTTYLSNIAESNTTSDTIAATALFRSAVSDTANASDAAAAAMLFASSFSDTVNATDSISSKATFGSLVSDTVNATDSMAAQEVFGSSISESVTAVDSVSAQEILYPAISETVGASETNSASATFLSTVSDTATATDSVSSNAAFSSAISDTVNVSDSPSAKAVFGSFVSNTVTVTDTPSAAQGFGTSVSEQANASETNAAAQGFSTTIAEQANASETNSTAQGFGSNISEQVNANDSISAMAMFAGYLNESATASESNSAKAVFGSNVSDSVTVDGSPSTQAIFNSTTQDTAQALDSISAAATFRGAVSESATAQDSDSVAASTFNAAAADNMQASNTFSGQASFGAAVSNTVNAADSDVGFISFPTSVSESATALDSVSAAQRFRTAIMESSQASNIFSAIEVFKSSISETVRASETNRGRVQFGSAVTDTARASETNRGRVRFGSAVNESITITDSDVGFISFPGSISESAQATEQNSAKAVFTPIVSDGAAASEFVATNFQVNSALSETAQASATNASNQGFGSAVSESAAANGTVLARAIFQGIISEAAQGSDQFSTTAVFLAAFSEFAQAYAEDVGYLTGSRAISESSTVFDSVSAAGALRGYISESATGVDSISAKFFHATFINESAQGLDFVDAPGSIYNVITSEQAAVNALPSTNAIFYAAVLAYAGITDVAYARYLWELIDNDQTSDWSNINDTQSAGWVEINDIQASNWQNVGNTQSSGWTEINDTQNPGWERITP